MTPRTGMLLALLLLAVAPSSAAQETPGAPDAAGTPGASALPEVTRATLAGAAAEAREAWEALCRASLGEAPAPITAFHLEAETRVRDGAQRNDSRISYRYLAPDCLRFRISDDKETGRFGRKRSEYWMKDGDEVLVLDSRDYAADRQSIEEMAALARNYIALSDPARLRIEGLHLLAGPPAELFPALRRRARKLVWLSVSSPDFALLGSQDAARPQERYRVDMGLRTEAGPGAWTPELVIVRAVAPPGMPTRDAVLLRLDDYRPTDGFRIPFRIAVHHLAAERLPPVFAEEASQEAAVLRANLRPELGVADFRP